MKLAAIGLLVIANLILVSWLITVVQTHSIQLSIPYGTTTYHLDISDGDTQSKNIANDFSRITTDAAKSTTHTMASGIGAIGSGIATAGKFVGSSIGSGARALASGVASVISFPGHILGHVSNNTVMSSLIKPADRNEKIAPTISAETSSAVLAQLDAQQRAKFAKLQKQQVTANKSLGGEAITSSANHGGYPASWNNIPQDSTLDRWGMYNRECVSYTAWKVYQAFGYMPYWGGVGNANQWVYDAERSGIPVGYTPRVHSVAISTAGYYGHSMWVEKVRGNMIYVSQYNYDLQGHYSEMWVSSSYLTYIYFK